MKKTTPLWDQQSKTEIVTQHDRCGGMQPLPFFPLQYFFHRFVKGSSWEASMAGLRLLNPTGSQQFTCGSCGRDSCAAGEQHGLWSPSLEEELVSMT